MAASLMDGPVFDDPGMRAITQNYLDEIPEKMRPIIAKFLPEMIKSTAIAYTREFALDELQEIRNFAQTPAGRHYFSSVQSLLSDPVVAAANQKFFAEVSKAQQEDVGQLQQEITEYLAANPEVLERLNAAQIGEEK